MINYFHIIFYELIPVNMPNYLYLFDGNSSLRSIHLYELSFVSNLDSTTARMYNINKSFFLHSHTLWDSMPFDIRNSSSPSEYKNKLTKHFWDQTEPNLIHSKEEWFF